MSGLLGAKPRPRLGEGKALRGVSPSHFDAIANTSLFNQMICLPRPLAILILFALLTLSSASLRCAAHRRELPVHPYENLLSILADFQWHLEDDIYRFPYPRDAAGNSIFKITIVRLANYQELYPDRFRDIVAFARAQAYERLGDYQQAIANYQQVLGNNTELKPLAQEKMAIAEEFNEIISQPLDQRTLQGYMDALKDKIAQLNQLITLYEGTPYEALAKVEKENAEVEYAVLLIENRMVIRDGVEKAVIQIQKLIQNNSESKRTYSHLVLLADFYFALAKEYVLLNDPEQAAFKIEEFEALVSAARAQYYQVEQADGYEEKLEARAKLKALGEFTNTIAARAK